MRRKLVEPIERSVSKSMGDQLRVLQIVARQLLLQDVGDAAPHSVERG